MKFSSPKKLNKTPLGEARCFSSIQFFNSSPPFPKYSQSGHLWYPITHCVVLVLV